MAGRQKESPCDVKETLRMLPVSKKIPLVKIKSLFCLSSELDPEPNKGAFLLILGETMLSF